MFTAVGFTTEGEGGFCASIGVTSSNPQVVADQLARQFGIVFEQILLMENSRSGPIVVHHWAVGDHYEEKKVSDECDE